MNANGGGISLGHPVGMTGARLIVSLVHEMNRRGVALWRRLTLRRRRSVYFDDCGDGDSDSNPGHCEEENMANNVVLYEKQGPDRFHYDQRPEVRNPLNMAVFRALTASLIQTASDEEVRVVIVTGAGSAFVAGADINELLAIDTQAAGQPPVISNRYSTSWRGSVNLPLQPLMVLPWEADWNWPCPVPSGLPSTKAKTRFSRTGPGHHPRFRRNGTPGPGS